VSEGLQAGHFVLYPSISFEYKDDDNVFYASRELPRNQIVQSRVLAVQSRILMDLPVGSTRIRWVYAPMYRNYSSKAFAQTRPISHFFDFEALRVGPVVTLRAADHFVRDTVDLRQTDQGGETVGVVPFTTHTPELGVTVGMGARSAIAFAPRYTSVTFDERGSTSLLGYRRKELEVRLEHAVSPPGRVYAFYALDDTRQQREQIVFGDVSLDARTLGLGLRRTINEEVVTYLNAGYKTIDFKGGSNSDFKGPVLDANATWQLGDVTVLNLSTGHQAYQSFYVNNNYYVATELRLRLTRQVGRTVFWDTSVYFTNNHYADPLDISDTPDTAPEQDCNTTVPDPGNPGQTLCVGDGRIDAYEALQPSVGRRRRDHVYHAEVGAGWQIARTLRLFIGYNYERRSSNIDEGSGGGIIDPFDYRIHRVLFRFEAGWM